MIKKQILLTVLIGILTLSACGSYGNHVRTAPAGVDKEFVNTEVNTGTAETFVESSRQEIDLKAALAMFPIIVKGYCCGIEEDGMKRFSISESYRGGLQGIVSVHFVDFQPKMEQEYLLFAEPFANVMSDKDYLLAGDIVWEEDETSKSFVISGIEKMPFLSLKKQLLELMEQYPYTGDGRTTGDYIHSDDLQDIYEQSPFVVYGTIQEIQRKLSDRMWCSLTEIKTIKGEGISEKSCIVLPLDSVEPGESFVFFLRSVEGADAFIISAPKGILTLEEIEEIGLEIK